uniref:Uncharacterized protein n=1 Tax=Molossus molossus TaxID=27622 RepID=A0A7J8CZX3_MOLMO|nr:hypothetical protein HJG59_009549 [Molossus molossus]
MSRGPRPRGVHHQAGEAENRSVTTDTSKYAVATCIAYTIRMQVNWLEMKEEEELGHEGFPAGGGCGTGRGASVTHVGAAIQGTPRNSQSATWRTPSVHTRHSRRRTPLLSFLSSPLWPQQGRALQPSWRVREIRLGIREEAITADF